VDQLARPSAVVSGKVTFSDGNTAWHRSNGPAWLIPTPGYRPWLDVQPFQMALEAD
jgi:hypothetical protein